MGFRRKGSGSPKKNKFLRTSRDTQYAHISPVELSGRSFDSKAERDFFVCLKAREQSGELSNIRCQVTLELIPAIRPFRAITYRVDFVAFDTESKQDEYYEVKGWPSETWELKKKLWAACGVGPLHIWKNSWGKTVFDQTIEPDLQAMIRFLKQRLLAVGKQQEMKLDGGPA